MIYVIATEIMLVRVLLSNSKRPYPDRGSRLSMSLSRSLKVSWGSPLLAITSSMPSLRYRLSLLTLWIEKINSLRFKSWAAQYMRYPLIVIRMGCSSFMLFVPIARPMPKNPLTIHKIWLKLRKVRMLKIILHILLILSWPGPDQLGENVRQKLLINVPSLTSTFKVL